MNTRSFLKSLLVGAVAPQVLTSVLSDRFRWKGPLLVPNPAWVEAPFEVSCIVFSTDLAGHTKFLSGVEKWEWMMKDQLANRKARQDELLNSKLEWGANRVPRRYQLSNGKFVEVKS